MLTYALEKAIFGEYGNAQRQEKNTIRLYEGKTRESVKAEVRPSGSAGDSASLSLSVYPYYFVAACACLAERSDATCHRQAHAVVPISFDIITK